MCTNNNKILLVIRHPVGGIKSYLKYVYRPQYFNKYKITIIAPYDDDYVQNIADELGMNVIYPGNNIFLFFLMIFRQLATKNYAMVHSHGFTSGIYTALISYINPVTHIMTSHDILQDSQFKTWLGPLKKRFMAVLLNRIDAILSVSYDARDNFMGMMPNVTRPEHVVIFNGIDVRSYLEAEVRDFRKELNINKKCYLLGFLGRFMSQKGFRDIIEAMEILSNKHQTEKEIFILAFGFGGYIREDKELINEKGLSDNFIFLPAVDNAAETLKGLDALLMPSLWEACPLLAMECLVAGTPLIASDCIGLREVTKGSPSFITEKKNPSDLADTIIKFMKNNKAGEFENYRKIASSRFDVTNTSKQLAEYYDRVMD